MDFKSQKLILTTMLLFLFSYSLAFCQSASDSISFTKKEIAFFKWGTGEKEVKLTKTAEVFSWPRALRIDGSDNLYFSAGNGHIFIVSPNGNSIKSISNQKMGGLGDVDEDGDMYSGYKEEGKLTGLLVIGPDGTQTVYKNFILRNVENGVAYPMNFPDAKGIEPITFFKNDDKPEKLPPRLFHIQGGEEDYEKTSPNTYVLHTEKINKHLKKINRHLDVDKIQIKIEEKKI